MEISNKGWVVIGIIIGIIIGVLSVLNLNLFGFSDLSEEQIGKCGVTCLDAGLYYDFCIDFCDDFEVNWINFLPQNSSEVLE